MKIPRRTFTALLFTFAGAAQANDLLGRAEYAPWNLSRSVGYNDHARSDGTWSIEALSSRRERSGYASEMALYRAAEIATQQGHRYFQLLRSVGTIGTGTMNRDVEDVRLIVRFADNDAPPADCRQPSRYLGRCYTAEAASLLARLEHDVHDATRKSQREEWTKATQTAADPAVHRASTVFQFDISESGLVENCHTVETDAAPDPNISGCHILTTKAHFTPATDAEGKPARVTRKMRVVWEVHGDPHAPTMTLTNEGTAKIDATPAPIAAIAPAPIALPTPPVVQAPPTKKATPAPAHRAFPHDDAIEVVL